MTTAQVNLKNLDVALLLDFSGTMSTVDAGGGGAMSRLQAMQESAKAFAQELEKFDPDGITVAKFAGKVKMYDNVKASKVDDIFRENRAMGSTATDEALRVAAEKLLSKKRDGRQMFIGILTDGVPDNPVALAQQIVNLSRKVKDRRELGILFIQVGKDAEAAAYLAKLNNDLTTAGAAHDLVAVCKLDDLEDLTTEEIVEMAFSE